LCHVAVAIVAAGKTRIEGVGIHRRFVDQWVKATAQSGQVALAGRHQNCRSGEQKALSAVQEDRPRCLIA